MQLSRFKVDTFQSDIVRIWVHIKLLPFYYKANALTTETYTPTHHCRSVIPTQPYPYPQQGMPHFFLQEIGRRITKSNFRVLK